MNKLDHGEIGGNHMEISLWHENVHVLNSTTLTEIPCNMIWPHKH